MNDDTFVGVGTVAASFGVTPGAVRKWEAAGLLPPAFRVDSLGRRVWKLADIEEARERVERRRAKEVRTASTA